VIYQEQISGPMLDRIDIHIEVPRVDYEKLSSDQLGEPLAAIKIHKSRSVPGRRILNQPN
jgi:predicted ATPase with chaperone activity